MNDRATVSPPRAADAATNAASPPAVRRFSFQLTIATIFGTFLFAAIASVVWFDYAGNAQSALEAADAQIDEINDKIVGAVRLEFEPVIGAVRLAATVRGLDAAPGPADHPLRAVFAAAAAAYPQIESLFAGFDNGNFFQVVAYAEKDDARRAARKAPAGARIETRTIVPDESGARAELRSYFDAGGLALGRRPTPRVPYDPRTRPWFQAVDDDDREAWTDLFLFATSRHVGITYAHRFAGSPAGVIGANVTLARVSEFLAAQRLVAGSRLIVFDIDGQVLAHPDPAKVVKTVAGFRGSMVEPATVADLGDPVLGEVFRRFVAGSSEGVREIEFRAGARDYIGKITPLPESSGPGGFLAVAVPIEGIVAPIARARDRSLMFAGLLALVAIGFVAWVSRRIAGPLRKLAAETARIRDLHLAGRIDVSSRIVEVAQLADGLASMKSALRIFGQYVPRDLVRQFVRSGIEPAIGGEKRELTVLFTDIKDFTALADSIPPEELMTRTASYFDRLIAPIVAREGVIDKYIGDAVMAFWNAPNPDPDHVLNACLAVLEARAAVAVFNAELVAKSQPPMLTRFGLHTGEVVVGNLGSRERMDYTAVGGNVNLASRLEGLNAFYGTEILVSEAVLPHVFGKFALRPIDVVIPKGKSEPVGIYELRAGMRGAVELPARLLADPAEEARCARCWDAYLAYRNREWDKAIALYAALATEDPADKVAPLYVARASRHRAEPPPADWSGAERFETK